MEINNAQIPRRIVDHVNNKPSSKKENVQTTSEQKEDEATAKTFERENRFRQAKNWFSTQNTTTPAGSSTETPSSSGERGE